MPINRVKQAIKDIKSGKPVIMIDDEDRENEGDIVYAATFTTPELVNFCVKEARGLVCVSLNSQIAKRLDLNPMVSQNNSSYETAFTVSVDAKECATGISASERNKTIELLASPNSKASDLVRPGHIFPLIAKDGGVLVRTGHTEGSVDLCKLAGLSPSAVICEIMKEDGDMARRDDLEIFAKKHDLNIVYISDLVAYRLENETLLKIIAESNTTLLDFPVRRIDFLDHNDDHHVAFVFNRENSKNYVRFQNITTDLDLLAQNRLGPLLKSLELLDKNGGILIYLQKAINENPYMKEYGIGAQILHILGYKEIRLLVSHKRKEFVGISGFGLEVVEEITL